MCGLSESAGRNCGGRRSYEHPARLFVCDQGAHMEVLDEGPPGMIIGGVAVIALGFPRTTIDIDATVWSRSMTWTLL